MLREALSKSGYNQEEFYFHEENRKLIEQIRKDPLKIPRALRDLARKTEETAVKSGASAGDTSPQKKVA